MVWKEMTRRCPKLLRFSVGEQGLMDIYPADVKHIAEKCSQLTILNLRGCVMAVNDQSLDRIVTKCTNLQNLVLQAITLPLPHFSFPSEHRRVRACYR